MSRFDPYPRKIIMIVILCVFCAKFGRAVELDVKYPLLPTKLNVNKVILCIGDGMGLAQVFAARIKAYGAFGRLHMELMPVAGLSNTCSADALITDSGAGATAIATCVKTNNGMIGIDPNRLPRQSILEACKAHGMATVL